MDTSIDHGTQGHRDLLFSLRRPVRRPYCKTQLIELQGRVKGPRTDGLGLAAISFDSPAILETFRRQHAITRSRSYPTRVQQSSNDTAFSIRLPKRLGDPTATVQWSNPISKNMYRPCVGLNVPSAWLLFW